MAYVSFSMAGPETAIKALEEFKAELPKRIMKELVRGPGVYLRRYIRSKLPWYRGNLRKSINMWVLMRQDRQWGVIPKIPPLSATGGEGDLSRVAKNPTMASLLPYGVSQWTLKDDVTKRMIQHRGMSEYSFVLVVGPSRDGGFAMNFLEYGTGGRRVGGPRHGPYVVFPVAAFALKIGNTNTFNTLAAKAVHPGISPRRIMHTAKLQARDRVISLATRRARYQADYLIAGIGAAGVIAASRRGKLLSQVQARAAWRHSAKMKKFRFFKAGAFILSRGKLRVMSRRIDANVDRLAQDTARLWGMGRRGAADFGGYVFGRTRIPPPPF